MPVKRFCCYTEHTINNQAIIITTVVRGGKYRRALHAGNVKQLQEIRLNEDLLLKI
jgi:hypothetical protein